MPRYRDDPIPELKRVLAAELVRAMQGWLPGQIINVVHIDQPRISDLRRGRLERLSVTRMIRWLAQLDRVVEVSFADARHARRRSD